MDDFDKNILQVMSELGKYQRHFNQLQHQYRALTSAWMLGMFAGIQYVLSNWGRLPFPSEAVLAFLGLAAAVGITQLWNLDIRVYHQLKDSCFVECLELEKRYSWLPKVHTNMLRTQATKEKGVLARVVWFYLVGNSVALLVAALGISLSAVSLPNFQAWGVALISSVGIICLLIWGYEIYRNTRSPLLEERSNQYMQPTC